MVKRLGKKNEDSNMSIEAYACSCVECSCIDKECSCLDVVSFEVNFNQTNYLALNWNTSSNLYSRKSQK